MSVFIHNVHSSAPNPGLRVGGTSGWYPPDNNIVKIGHGYQGGPQMSFYDVQTGYQIEKFQLQCDTVRISSTTMFGGIGIIIG